MKCAKCDHAIDHGVCNVDTCKCICDVAGAAEVLHRDV